MASARAHAWTAASSRLVGGRPRAGVVEGLPHTGEAFARLSVAVRLGLRRERAQPQARRGCRRTPPRRSRGRGRGPRRRGRRRRPGRPAHSSTSAPVSTRYRAVGLRGILRLDDDPGLLEPLPRLVEVPARHRDAAGLPQDRHRHDPAGVLRHRFGDHAAGFGDPPRVAEGLGEVGLEEADPLAGQTHPGEDVGALAGDHDDLVDPAAEPENVSQVDVGRREVVGIADLQRDGQGLTQQPRAGLDVAVSRLHEPGGVDQQPLLAPGTDLPGDLETPTAGLLSDVET